MKRTSLIFNLSLALLLISGALIWRDVFAQGPDMQTFAEQAGFFSGDLRLVVARLIRTVISFAGIILVIMLMIGAVQYMTAGGAQDRIDKAKKTIMRAIIGLVIVVSSFVIAQFVVNQVTKAVGGGGIVGEDDGGCANCLGDGRINAKRYFALSSWNEACAPLVRNFAPQFVFTQPVARGSVVSSSGVPLGIVVKEAASGTVVNGSWNISGKTATFAPNNQCPGQANEHCFSTATDYSVEFKQTVLRSASGRTLTCGGNFLPCVLSFTTGTVVDTRAPTVTMTNPSVSGASGTIGDIFPLQSRVQDETGASLAEFFVDDARQSVFAATLGTGERPSPDRFFNTDATEWNTKGYPAGLRQIWAKGADCAGHSGISAKVPFSLRALTCDNKKQDGDETGVDCGGSCLACAGQPCVKNSDCAVGLACRNNVCVASPRIDRITPGDGKAGNLVTISGLGFGSSAGTVKFVGELEADGDDVVIPPYAGCSGTWSDKQVIIRLENAMKSGPIQLIVADTTKTDRTDDDYGPRISDFEINNIARPGVCSIAPPAGKGGISAVLAGNGFGASRGTSGTVYYGNTLAAAYGLWSDTSAVTTVPLLDSQVHAVQLFVGENLCAGTTTACRTDADCGTGTCVKGRQGSNTVSFTATSDADRVVPIITSIETGWRACNDQTTDAAKKLKHCGADGDCPGGACVAAPNWGPAGQYVTIYGSKFGTSGLVRFRSKTDRKEAIGDTAFPEQCGSGIWKDGFVVIKVPKQFLDGGFVGVGTYEVSVERSGLESAPKDFVVVDELPGPGICRVNPSAGPVGQSVSVFGEHFVGDSGRVVFNDQKESPMTETPLETSLRTIVPTGAVTGPMFVERTAPGVFKSNSVNFAVGNCKNNASICGSGEQCCANGSCSVECAKPVDAHYAYLFSTGPIPKTPRVLVACTKGGTVSPSPWDGWSKPGTVCVDAVVTAEFGPSDIVGIDMQSVRDNLKIEKCSASGTNPCRTTEIVSGGSINGTAARIFTWDFTDAAKNFEPNTTYRVTLGKDVQSSSNIVDGVETGLVAMGQPFSWQFRTSSGTCTIGSLAVSPSEAAITELNGTKDYLALPEAKEDQCIVLSCSGHSVAWTSDDTNKAEMIGRAGSSNQCEDTAKGLRETLGIPVKISATMTDIAVRPKDDALLTVDFVDPRVVDYWPNCDQACVNAEIGAAFNTLMNRSTVTSSAVHVGKCDNADCLAPSPIAADVEYPVAGAPYEMRVLPRVALERNGYYRVTVDAGVSSLSDIKMKTAFQWQFRVKNTGELCQIERIQLQPKDSTLSRVGARQEIGARAVSKPDECSVNGQRLNAEMLSWSPWWTADKAPDKVRDKSIGAMLASKGAAEGEIKKFPTDRLPAWCSPSCLNLGSVVQSGEPVCGNGGPPENGEDCDDGNTENGDGCSSHCLFEPSLKCGKYCEGTNTVCSDNTSCPSGVPCEERADSCCGDGTVQPFEQCDPMKSGTLRCSDVCLNTGTNRELCGNGYAESGESCDGGSGCTTQCLHTGSVPKPLSGGVCGNGRIEEGEECDGVLGCGAFCVWEGTPACAADKVCLKNNENTGISCVNKSQCQEGEECDYPVSFCCGNGEREKGEDCDDGNTENGDGCSSHCLNEGSSVYYTDPSFCGDGELGVGEECEAPSAGAVGPYGAIEISKFAPQEVDEKTGKAVAVVSARAQGKIGTAEVSLQCSCERDDACGNAVSYGCGKAKCCYDRPAIEAILPADGTEDRCLNVAISALFSKPMDPASFDQSVDANKDGRLDASEFKPNAYLEILKDQNTSYPSGDPCPPGTSYAIELPLQGNWFARARQMIGRAIRSFIANDAEAVAPHGCFVPLTFKAQEKSVSFEYKQALAENSWYRLTIVGDSDPTNGVREGALSEDLVGLSLPSSIRTAEFKTGGEICTIGAVDVQDNGKENIAEYENSSKLLFTKSGERHGFVAKALSAELFPPNNSPQEIAPTTAYGWNWSWSSTKNDGPNPPAAEDNIVTTEFTPIGSPTAKTNAVVVAGTKNGGTYKLATKSGEETVIATATITTENPPKDVYGQALVRAELCENPSIQASPFEDDAMNFSFFYCRDSGEEGNTQDDLNDVKIQVVPNPLSDILKELLVKIDGTPDAIGIRIAENRKYLTPSEWYAEKGFRGSPSPVVADGYSAVQDGATWYIAAPNQSKEDGKEVIYSNIYIVSYNQNASAASKEIFARILSSWRFNSDITNLQICKNDTGGYYKPTGSSSYVSCASDQDCAVQKCVKDKCSVTGHACANDNECIGKGTSGFTCDADKSKIQRDFKRIFDAVRVQDILFRYGVNHKRCSITRSQTCASAASCPGGEECLATVPSIETGSFIRSMSVSVWPSWGAVLGNALGQSLPNDPINAFRTCSGAGYDPVTCYNAAENKFSCSKNSFVYGFKSLFGDRYEWRANLEYGKAGWVNKVKKYDDPNALIVLQYPEERDQTIVPDVKSGFTTDLTFCRDEIVGDSDACGDGIKGKNEECEVGNVKSVSCKVCYSPDAKKTGLACTAPSDCQNKNTCEIPSGQTTGKCKQSGEECQNNDGCVNTGWACMDGKKDAKCLDSGANACKEYETAEQSTSRCAVAQCGNGIVESPNEQCDAGSRNGSYGVACSPQCKLFGTDTFYCGDGYLAGGEQCDCGTVANFPGLLTTSWAKISGNCNGAASGTNGQYVTDSLKSCSFDCKRPGPSCGDGILNGSEQCDGGKDTVTTGCPANAHICIGGPNAGLECPTTGCGVGGRCSDQTYQLSKTRSCVTSGANACTWETVYGACAVPIGVRCGDGDVNGSEECDDGNTDNTDSCTTECKPNICGDGYTYRGVESCDAGAKNGVSCTAPYAGLCNYCTVDCQYKTKTGEYCGDGKKNGPEVCEGDEAVWLGCLKADNATGFSERDDTRSCANENEAGAVPPSTAACKVGYTCRKLGVCGGGPQIGKPCTINAALTDANTFSCGLNFKCVAPHCSTTCDAMCPFNFELATLTATSPVPNSRPQSSIKLYSVDKGSPDSATLHFPACSAAQSLVADINMDSVEKQDVDVVFVTDVSGSMAGSKIEAARSSISKAIDDLFNGYTAATLRIGLVRFGTKEKVCSDGENAGQSCEDDGQCPDGSCEWNSDNRSCQGGDKDGQSCGGNSDCTNGGHCVAVKIDYPLSQIHSKEAMKQTVGLYQAEGGTPTLEGVNRGIKVLKASNSSAVKILVLLSDGKPNSVNVCIGGDNFGKECKADYECPSSYCRDNNDSADAHVKAVRDLIIAEANVPTRFFSAAITTDPSLIGYMAHMSDDVCRISWTSSADCQPNQGVEYAFNGMSATEIASMYQQITSTILGAVVSFTTAVGSQVTVSEPLPLKSGVNQTIPFPSAFACNNQSQNAPFQLNFTGTGQVELSKMKFTYCPARPR